MLQVLGLFFLDLLLFNLFNSFVVSTLLVYWIVLLLEHNKNGWLSVIVMLGLLLQDFVVHGRIGICLVYLIPMIFFGGGARRFFPQGAIFPHILFLLLAFVGVFSIERLGLGQELSMPSTFVIILVNIIVMIFSLKMRGMRGNRSL